MAYSNWGAFVRKNDERRRDREDVAPFGDDGGGTPSGARIWISLLKAREKYKEGEQPWHEHIHHAVLGDGPVRVCGYKCSPEIFIARDGVPEKIEPKIYDDHWNRLEGVHSGEVEVEGQKYKWSFDLQDNRVDLYLEEPDGSEWHGECGYMMGAGHQD